MLYSPPLTLRARERLENDRMEDYYDPKGVLEMEEARAEYEQCRAEYLYDLRNDR